MTGHFLRVKHQIVDTSEKQVNSFLHGAIRALGFKKTCSILRLEGSQANDYTRHVFPEQIRLPKWPLRRLKKLGRHLSWSRWSNKPGTCSNRIVFMSRIPQKRKSYPVFGEKVVSKVNFSPLAIWAIKRGERHLTRQEVCQQVPMVTMSAVLFSNLIFNGDFCSQGVVSVPLFGESQAIFWPFVLGFQGTSNFASVSVGGTGSFEFLQGLMLETAVRGNCLRHHSLNR